MSEEEHVDPPLTIGAHLEALRMHVLRCVLYVVVGLAVGLTFQDYLFDWATWPHRKTVHELSTEAALEGAPAELRGLLAEVTEDDADLDKAFDDSQRLVMSLREQLTPSTEKLEDLRTRQAALRKRLEGLKERARALSGGEFHEAEVETLAREREALALERKALQWRVDREVKPFLDAHARAPKIELIQFKYQEGFLSLLKLALVAGIFLTSPLCAWEMWRFVAVGLYPHEKRYVNLFAPLTFGAFITGAAFGYYVLIPFGLRFLATYAPPELVSGTFAMGDYLSLFTTLTIVVGLVFELPLVMSFLTLINIGGSAFYRKYRRHMLLGAFVASAMITPPDPATQCLMAIPLIFLYQIGIWCSAAIERRRVEADSEPPPPPPQKGDGGAPKGLEPPDDGGPGPEPAEPSDPAPQGGAEERPGGDADPVPVIAPPETPTVARGSLDAPEPEPEPVASEPEPEPVASEPEPEPVASEPEPEPEPEPRVPEDLRAALERKKALLAGSAGVHPETGEPLPAGAFVDQNGRVWYQPEEQLEGSDGDNDDPTLDVYEDEEPADAAPVHAGEGEAEDPPEETS